MFGLYSPNSTKSPHNLFSWTMHSTTGTNQLHPFVWSAKFCSPFLWKAFHKNQSRIRLTKKQTAVWYWVQYVVYGTCNLGQSGALWRHHNKPNEVDFLSSILIERERETIQHMIGFSWRSTPCHQYHTGLIKKSPCSSLNTVAQRIWKIVITELSDEIPLRQ